MKHLSDVLQEYLYGCLEGINYCIRIHPNTKNIHCDFNKRFSLPSNYPKGKGTEFKYWCVTYHPNGALYPVEQTTGASNDMVIEGAVPTYTNALLYKLLLDKALSTLDAEISCKKIYSSSYILLR